MEVSASQQLERAKQHFELTDYHGAIVLLQELVDEGRAFADAYHLLGLCEHMVGQPERALAAFDHALRLNPRYIEALLHRGVVLAELGREDEAADAFRAARESGSGERAGVPVHHADKLANLHADLADAYAQAGALSRAIEQLRAALELGPAFHDLRYRMGRYLLDSGRSLEAREELERVVDARPGSTEARCAYALACYLSGDAPTAREQLDAVLATDPTHIRATAYRELVERASVV
jgi:tetratricopeptide (TPR) repeat protein